MFLLPRNGLCTSLGHLLIVDQVGHDGQDTWFGLWTLKLYWTQFSQVTSEFTEPILVNVLRLDIYDFILSVHCSYIVYSCTFL